MLYLYIGLVGLFSGSVKGTSGFGPSLVALPLLLILGVHRTEILVILITTNLILNTMLLFENKAFEFTNLKQISVLTVSGIIFTGIGIIFLSEMDDLIVKIIAILLILFAIYNKAFKHTISIKDNPVLQFLTGMFSGIGNGIASIDGPPVVFYLTAIDAKKAKFKNTLATYFLIMGLIAVGLLISTSSYNLEIFKMISAFAPGAIVGTLLGMMFSGKLNQKQFDYVIIVILIALVSYMIINL